MRTEELEELHRHSLVKFLAPLTMDGVREMAMDVFENSNYAVQLRTELTEHYGSRLEFPVGHQTPQKIQFLNILKNQSP